MDPKHLKQNRKESDYVMQLLEISMCEYKLWNTAQGQQLSNLVWYIIWDSVKAHEITRGLCKAIQYCNK